MNKRRILRLLQSGGLLVVYAAILLIGVSVWEQGQTQWGIALDAQGPQPCATGTATNPTTSYCIASWHIASATTGEAYAHSITAGSYICAADGAPITTSTPATAVEDAQDLLLSETADCRSTYHASLGADLIPGGIALVDWLIAVICGALAILITLYAARRTFVVNMVSLLSLIFVAFAWIPPGLNNPLISELNIIAASYFVPVVLAILIWRLLFPPRRPVTRIITHTIFGVLLAIAAILATTFLVSSVLNSDAVYTLDHQISGVFLAAMYLLSLSLVAVGNIAHREPSQRDYARILGAGVLIALIPLFLFGVLPTFIPFSFIIGSSTAAFSVVALPLTLTYVVLKRDLLGVDSRVRFTTERVLGIFGVVIVAAILLSLSAVIFNIPINIITFVAPAAIVIGLLAPMIFRGMRAFTEAWLFPEMRRYRRLIRNARAGGSAQEREIADALIGEVTFAIPVRQATLLVRHDNAGLFEVVGGQEIAPVTVDHPILHQFTGKKVALVRADLASFAPLPFQAPPNAHWECFVPIVLEERLIGLLLLGPREDDIGYSATDRTQLFRLANQRAVALDYLRVLTALRSALEEQKRIDALKDQFIMTAHHELRTPLTSMIGYMDIVARLDAATLQRDPEDVEFMLGEALRSGEDLVHLLDTLLAADRASVRAPELHPAYIALAETLRRLAADTDMSKPNQPNRVSIQCPADLTGWADREAFNQVLINLLSNASKYSPEDAPIEVRAWRHDDGRMVEVTVRDYGDGVPLDQQKAIFEKFIRLERDLNSSIRGTGLGLAIVRDRVEAMGGKVWVESTGIPGEGSTFHVTIPATPLAAENNAADAAPITAPMPAVASAPVAPPAAEVTPVTAPLPPAALPVDAAVPAPPSQPSAAPTPGVMTPERTPDSGAVDPLTDTLPRRKLVRYGPPEGEA